MESLTRRQLDLLNYMADARSSRGRAPTRREMAAALGLCVAGVQKHVRALARKGFLRVDRYARRGIRLARTRRDGRVRREGSGEFERRIEAKLRDATDLARIFEVVRKDLRAWVGADAADLLVYDPQRRELRDGAACGVDSGGPSAEEVRTVDPGSPAGAAFRRRKPVIETGAAPTPAFERERAARPGLRACLAVPVHGRDRVLGILRLDDRRRADGFDDVKRTRAAMAAAALAPALERGTLDAELRRRIRLQGALIELCRTVNSPGDLRAVLRDVYGIVRGLVDAPVFFIAVREAADRWWILMETDEFDGKRIDNYVPRRADLDDYEALFALRTRPFAIRHRTPEEVKALEAKGPQAGPGVITPIGHVQKRSCSFLHVPLKTEGEVVGCLSAQSYRFEAYSVRDAEDLALIAEYVGLAVRNAWRDELERMRAGSGARRIPRLREVGGRLEKIAELPGDEMKARIRELARELITR